MKIKEKNTEALKSLKHTNQQLTIKDATLEDKLDEEAEKEIEKGRFDVQNK